MIIFTSEVFALEIYQWRKDFLHQTKIIVRQFDSFAMTCPSMMSFWEKQVTLDPEQGNSSELYAMWALKQELTRIAIVLNTFQSKWFVWCDIGIQRYSKLQELYTKFPSEISFLCKPGRMAFFRS